MDDMLLDGDELEHLAKQIKYRMDPMTLQRGLRYAKEGKVHVLAWEGDWLRARVQGSWTYEVGVNWRNLEASRCDCPVEGLCKHIGAVFFAVYLQEFTAEEFWSMYEGRTVVFKQGNRGAKPPLPGDGPEAWEGYLAETYREMSRQRALHPYASIWGPIVSDFSRQVAAVAAHWPEEEKRMFAFQCKLFELVQREKAESQMGFWGETQAVQRLFEEVMAEAEELIRREVWERKPDFARYVVGLLRRELFENLTGRADRLLGAYRWLWIIFCRLPGMAEEERACLTRMLEGAKEKGAVPRYAMLALAHQEVLEGQDGRARKWLEDCADQQALRSSDILFYPIFFYEVEAWERLREWLRWANGFADRLYGDDFVVLYQGWLAVGEELQAWDEVDKVFKGWPRAGQKYYADYLFETERYKEWVSLQMLEGWGVFDLDKEDLIEIQDHNPRLLLPLYHQGIARCIEEKRRDSYKLAVRLMKRLRTLYKRVRRLDDWEAYLDLLTQRYARLRALQEEMRKGKLIPWE